MNVERIISSLGCYTDSPETIQKARKVIVALAVAGKLDKSDGDIRDSEDEFAKSLRLTSSQKGRSATGAGCTPLFADFPEGLPFSVQYVSLGSIAEIVKGKTAIKQAAAGSYPLVVTASERASCTHFDFDGAAAIIPLVSSTGHGKASLHRLHYQEGKFALGTILAAVFPKAPEAMSARFLFEYLSAFKDELLVTRMIGTANVSLTIRKIQDVPVPIVTPSAQRRLDELMALLDHLQAARAQREEIRCRLFDALLKEVLITKNKRGKSKQLHAESPMK